MSRHVSFHPRVHAVIAAIRRLSPHERRQLLRRLRVSGLLEQDELLTDQDRLDVAPALGTDVALWRETPTPPSAVTPSEPVAPEDSAPISDNAYSSTVYQSAVSGKVVVGAPEGPSSDDPSIMLPLPGRAPEQPVVLVFDGGSKGNPGRGYGSYALQWPGQSQQIVQLQFGDQVTNNEAEYDTLIAGLEAVAKRLAEAHADPSTATVHVYGDSLLVINQVKSLWSCKEPRLRPRRDHVQRLLGQFGHTRLIHHDRSNSVDILGH